LFVSKNGVKQAMPLELQQKHQSNSFTPISEKHLSAFRSMLGVTHVLTENEQLIDYGHDWTEDLLFMPEVVLKPNSTQEVSQVMAYCHAQLIAVTPCGGRTGLSGGMLPVYGGVMLSLERMNRIIDIDTKSLQITVEPGVITQTIHEAVEAHGLMYPPDPSSKGSCMIGGNVAENAGGARAVKYGITREYVLALEVVLANGDVIHTGAKVLKNSTGYNLTHLIVGSEGTLGVVTQIVLKLVPKPALEYTLLVPFAKAVDACKAVSAVFQHGIVPSAIEFIEKDALDFGQQYLGMNTYDTTGIEAHLLINLDGNHEQVLVEQSEALAELFEHMGGGEMLFASSQAEKEALWKLRRCLGEAVKGTTIYKEEDTVVPRAELANLLSYIKQLGREHNFYSVCYGHAGDGNLHINIIKQNMSETEWKEMLPKAIEKLFQYVVQLGGTLSGEHGIGYVQQRYMPIAFSSVELELMRNIKGVFDPKGILNPGKILNPSLT
jgi:glycolate oxidase